MDDGLAAIDACSETLFRPRSKCSFQGTIDGARTCQAAKSTPACKATLAVPAPNACDRQWRRARRCFSTMEIARASGVPECSTLAAGEFAFDDVISPSLTDGSSAPSRSAGPQRSCEAVDIDSWATGLETRSFLRFTKCSGGCVQGDDDVTKRAETGRRACDCPEQSTSQLCVLVGLLTSEHRALPTFSSNGHRPASTMAYERESSHKSLGYSGGAVPELHRYSLFADEVSLRRPPALNQSMSLTQRSRSVNATHSIAASKPYGW